MMNQILIFILFVSENKFLNNETKETLLNSGLADKFKEKLITTKII